MKREGRDEDWKEEERRQRESPSVAFVCGCASAQHRPSGQPLPPSEHSVATEGVDGAEDLILGRGRSAGATQGSASGIKGSCAPRKPSHSVAWRGCHGPHPLPTSQSPQSAQRLTPVSHTGEWGVPVGPSLPPPLSTSSVLCFHVHLIPSLLHLVHPHGRHSLLTALAWCTSRWSCCEEPLAHSALPHLPLRSRHLSKSADAGAVESDSLQVSCHRGSLSFHH